MPLANGPVPYVGPQSPGAVKEGTIFASASYGTGANNSAEFYNAGWRGIRLFVNITAVGGGGTVVFKVQNYDPVSASWFDVTNLASASLNANAATLITFYPSVNNTANTQVSQHLGCRWRLVATVGTNAVTFSVGGDYLI